jgi:alkanesulfonate monooxygenase SsuD/methylene tetrahydromethanopterin reductase-like flavin-dependent oxidoreductase (luciferase family)
MLTDRERVGIAFFPRSADTAVDLCVRAERANVSHAWMVMPATGLDTLTLIAAAAVQTERIVLGTSIVPAFTRHPLTFVTQALSLEGLAPGRLNLGIGTAHARTMVDVYHLDFAHPLHELAEYLEIVQAVLKTGASHFKGEYYKVDVNFPNPPGTPVPIAALRAPAFRLAGRLADGQYGPRGGAPPRWRAASLLRRCSLLRPDVRRRRLPVERGWQHQPRAD